MNDVSSEDCQIFCHLVCEQAKEVVSCVNSTFRNFGVKRHLAEDDNSYAEAAIVLFALTFGALASSDNESFVERMRLKLSLTDSLIAMVGSDEDANAYLSVIEAVAKAGLVDAVANGKNPFHQMALILLGKCLHGSYDFYLQNMEDMDLVIPSEMIGDMLACSASKNFMFWREKGLGRSAV